MPKTIKAGKVDVLVSQNQIELTRSVLSPKTDDSFVEFRALIAPTSRALLKYGCCIFHCVSFLWQDKAFLLTAPPGTGKTTQYLNWQRLFPGEINMICGDMPVLEGREDGSVWAHSSPWNGKEKLGNAVNGPVSGIVLLEQGKENRILKVSPREAIITFFGQVVGCPETEDQIIALAGILDKMLRNIPCYKFINRGDDESTKILRSALKECFPKGGTYGTI